MRKRSQQIRNLIIQNVKPFPKDIAKRTAIEFSISRQAVNRHLNQLLDEQVLEADGVTMNRNYRLRTIGWKRVFVRQPIG